MIALVQNGGGAVPEIAPAQTFGIGMRVRLRDDVDQLYTAQYERGGYTQRPFQSKELLREFRAGLRIVSVESLQQPIPVLNSASAEDCSHVFRFNLPMAHTARAFGAWQFEAVPVLE